MSPPPNNADLEEGDSPGSWSSARQHSPLERESGELGEASPAMVPGRQRGEGSKPHGPVGSASEKSDAVIVPRSPENSRVTPEEPEEGRNKAEGKPARSVASWASAPIELGPGNGGFRVLVLGPAQVPVVHDAAQARESPELAVMSALAHGNDPAVGREVAQAALAGLATFDSATARLYLYVIWKSVRGAMREALEAAIREAEARGELIEPPFLRELEEKWEARGKAEGRIESLLRVLAARGLAVSGEVKERILRTRELEQLDEWIQRAVTAVKVEEIFG